VQLNDDISNDVSGKAAERQEKRGAEPGWLPDDELTREWLRLVEQYRAQCDAADRRRLTEDATSGEAPS
jgi:hypothetical protein